MADDPNNRGQQDRIRINIHQDHEVRYWTEKFGVTAEQLKAAVKEVGSTLAAVEKWLASHNR